MIRHNHICNGQFTLCNSDDKFQPIFALVTKQSFLLCLALSCVIIGRALYSAVRKCHNGGGFRVGGGVHDSYTFQCRLEGSFTFPGIDTR